MSDAPDWVTQLNERLHDLENSVERRTTDQNIKDLTRAFTPKSSRNNGNGNGTLKGIGVIGLIITVLVGFVAIAEYMGRENEYIRKDMSRIELNLRDTDANAAKGAELEAKLQERFKEVETQFKALREVVDIQGQWEVSKQEDIKRRLLAMEDWLEWWHRTVPGMDSEQNVIINHLDRHIHDEEKVEYSNIYKGGTK